MLIWDRPDAVVEAILDLIGAERDHFDLTVEESLGLARDPLADSLGQGHILSRQTSRDLYLARHARFPLHRPRVEHSPLGAPPRGDEGGAGPPR